MALECIKVCGLFSQKSEKCAVEAEPAAFTCWLERGKKMSHDTPGVHTSAEEPPSVLYAREALSAELPWVSHSICIYLNQVK